LVEYRTKEVAMTRKVADCREMPSKSGCTLTIAGEEDEVVRAAAMHAVDVHGHPDSPELREQIRSVLKDGSPRANGARNGPTGRRVGEPLLHRVTFGIPPLGEMVLELEEVVADQGA